MKKNYFTPTFFIILLIVLAVLVIIFFNNKDNDENNNSPITPYTENNNYTNVTQNIQEKEAVCLASFSTNITYPDDNRNHNIILACKYLNNHVIKSNEVFSFNEVLGPFNEQQGYVESTGFDSDGNIIKIIGGGICQVSSTLYNCALISELEIIERHAHSMPVDYVPQGKDATVCYSDVDFKFKNTTDSDIIIKSFCDGNTVKIELYKK